MDSRVTRSQLIRMAHAHVELRPALLPFLSKWARQNAGSDPELARLLDCEREFVAALTRIYMRGGLGRMGRSVYGAALRTIDRVVAMAIEESSFRSDPNDERG